MDNQISINELLHTVGQLNTREFEEFFSKIQSLRLQKKAMDTVSVENKLIKQIKTGLLSSQQVRFEYLIARRDTHNITESELNELIKLTDEVEKNDVLRLKRIAKLADLKQMSVSDIVSHYNLRPLSNG